MDLIRQAPRGPRFDSWLSHVEDFLEVRAASQGAGHVFFSHLVFLAAYNGTSYSVPAETQARDGKTGALMDEVR